MDFLAQKVDCGIWEKFYKQFMVILIKKVPCVELMQILTVILHLKY